MSDRNTAGISSAYEKKLIESIDVLDAVLKRNFFANIMLKHKHIAASKSGEDSCN